MTSSDWMDVTIALIDQSYSLLWIYPTIWAMTLLRKTTAKN